MIDSRRMPSSKPSPSQKVPASSGPRCTMASPMAASASGDRRGAPDPRLTIPKMPHIRALPEILRERRTDQLSDAERQPAPCLNSPDELRVCGIEVRHLTTFHEEVLVVKRLRIESPVGLEVVGS